MKRAKLLKMVVHQKKTPGELDGISPGFRFFARCEMVVVGMAVAVEVARLVVEAPV